MSTYTNALQEFRLQNNEIIQLATKNILKDSEQVDAHGDKAKKRISSGLQFVSLFLQTALLVQNKNLLTLQIKWANERLPADNVKPKHILVNLQIFSDAVTEILSADDAILINEYINWMITKQKVWIETH